MAQGIFPTFFIAGFESSTFVWKDRQRKDYIKLTGHDRHVKQDCERLKDLGFGTARESIPWPFVDLGGGKNDWSRVQPFVDALNGCNITAVWDLFHYGLPDGENPLNEDTVKRFADYCRACAEFLAPQRPAPRFFTPVNEISFFSAACTDMGWMAPFEKGKAKEMKRALCKMAIEGAKAIREVDPGARMVHVDPLVHSVAPDGDPELQEQANRQNYIEAFEAWDMLSGQMAPELGGSPEILDIVGVNVYNFSQSQINKDGSRTVLGPRDPRRQPLAESLKFAYDRYHRPTIIGETSGWQEHRPEWLRMTMQECLKALNEGVDLQAVCLYPCVDIPDWQTGEWAKIGIFELQDTEKCERVPYGPYVEELRRWQHILDQPENVEPDGGRVELEEVKKKALEWAGRPDVSLR